MRRRHVYWMATLGLAFASPAAAETIELIWENTGTNQLIAAPSQTITANIVLTLVCTDIAWVGLSVQWDPDGDDELDFVQASSSGSNPNGTNWFDSSALGQGNTAGNPGFESQWLFFGDPPFSGAMTTGTATIGTITFHVTGNLNPSTPDVLPFFDVSDGCETITSTDCSDKFIFGGASASPVPEPGTAGLLVAGLLGIGWARRWQRPRS